MESAFLKKGPLRSGKINKDEEYGPYVLWKITLFWEMRMSQKTADGIFVQSVTAMLLPDWWVGGENLRTVMVTSMFWKPAG